MFYFLLQRNFILKVLRVPINWESDNMEGEAVITDGESNRSLASVERATQVNSLHSYMSNSF